ncbi:hypothetical protein XELAEV_18010294mg [Xenopus laevis]|uniref:GIY-YIG domain-containing protein n=1 Tax=Xenopus laevis TaxID=8355 RepID=A0A974DVK7_XENLA|nr:hypothetical protein XELAEV_18010294mg [Xenopus laevis]
MGYSHNCLKKAYKRALQCDRNQLLIPRKHTGSKTSTNTNKHLIRLIWDYSSQHKEIVNILQKHWHILRQDSELKEVIGESPQITYRRSNILHDRLIHSHCTNLTKKTWLSHNIKGCYRCGNCVACPFVSKRTTFLGRLDIKEYSIKHFINCKTTGIIYVMECICGKRYVGKTKREFKRRIMEHVGDVRNKRNTSIANHINEHHFGDCSIMKFIAVDHIKPTTRIGDIDRKLLQREAEWIYWLNSKTPAGLNEGFMFSPFL